jgi:hypothetical protein
MMAAPSAAGAAQGPVCLLCCRLVDPAERRCPAFTLAAIAAHAGCCGGCAAPGSVAGRPAGAPATAAVPMGLAPDAAACRVGVVG